MSGISNHGLIEIADLDQDPALRVRERAQVSQMAITANPNGRALRQLAPGAALEPPVKPFGAAADESMRGPRHLEITNRSESLCPVARIYHLMPRAASHEKVRPEWTAAIG